MTKLQGFERIHHFDEYDINKYVSTEGGNYRIGVYLNGRPVVRYVGRAENLNARLKYHLHYNDDLSGCDCFQILYEPDEVYRYFNECHDYHYFGGNKKLKNKVHPDKPDGLDLNCPFCYR